MSEYNNQTQGFELDWDSPIEHDSTGFELLPEGDYSFRVTKFERARYNGGPKLPPCNQAILTLEVSDGVHTGTIKHNLFLHSTCEGMICTFFVGIGQRKHGEKMIPNWNQVVGSTGTCKVGVRKWKGKDGQERDSNEIKRFYEKEQAPAPAAQPQQQPPQQMAWTQNNGYTPGNF